MHDEHDENPELQPTNDEQPQGETTDAQQNQKGMPFDDIEQLYISAHIKKSSAIITTDRGDLEAVVFGEVLLYGRNDGNEFVVERLRRVALYGALVDPDRDERIEVFSLSGPLETIQVSPGSTGIVDNLFLQLHYGELSRIPEPAYRSVDAVFPQVEWIQAEFTWAQASAFNQRTVQIRIQVSMIKQKTSIVEGFKLDPIELTFRLAGTGEPRPQPHFSLSSNCVSPASACLPPMKTVTRILPIKFIDFSNASLVLPIDQFSDLEAICQLQIDGVCEVWRNQAALDLDVQGMIEVGTVQQKAAFANLTLMQEKQLSESYYRSALAVLGPGLIAERIEVYIVDSLVSGQGVTYNCGTASAYCILAWEQASLNRYLLAHEIGHVIGLGHPGDAPSNPPYQTTPGSVMEVDDLNPNLNSQLNCDILTNQALGPLNAIIRTTNTDDCFRPSLPPPLEI